MAKTQSVDQLDHAAIRLISARPDVFARQGSVAATWRCRDGKRFGPYYRLAYRDDGRQCSVYLGRAGAVVERVRQMLHNLQKPLRQWRMYRRIDRQARAALRANNARVTALLRPLGLRLRGFEVRGWRRSPLRFWLPRRGQLMPSVSTPRLPPLPRISISLSSLSRNGMRAGVPASVRKQHDDENRADGHRLVIVLPPALRASPFSRVPRVPGGRPWRPRASRRRVPPPPDTSSAPAPGPRPAARRRR